MSTRTFSISIPPDDSGFFGRECPECEGTFKVTPGTGLSGIDQCYCPYCGHHGSNNTFWTKAQIEYAKSVVMNQVSGEMLRILKRHEFDIKPKGPFGIGFSLKVTGSAEPVSRYIEPRLETELVCDGCSLRYAIYGLFAFCPDCGIHNSQQILNKNIEVVRKLLALADTADEGLRERLVENALEDGVSAFDGFGREVCRVSLERVGKAVPSFQNIAAARDTLYQKLGFDLRARLTDDEWRFIVRAFQKRHVLAHKMGVVDQKYIDATNDASAVVGRKVSISADEVETVCDVLARLGAHLFDGLKS
jgi:hypothetical protein